MIQTPPLWDITIVNHFGCMTVYMCPLLMHASSAEGGRVAISLLQVRQGLFVQLHGISGEPAFYLSTSQMKPAAQTHRGAGLMGQINMKIVFFDMEQWLLTFFPHTTLTSSHPLKNSSSHSCASTRVTQLTIVFNFLAADDSWGWESIIRDNSLLYWKQRKIMLFHTTVVI